MQAQATELACFLTPDYASQTSGVLGCRWECNTEHAGDWDSGAEMAGGGKSRHTISILEPITIIQHTATKPNVLLLSCHINNKVLQAEEPEQ